MILIASTQLTLYQQDDSKESYNKHLYKNSCIILLKGCRNEGAGQISRQLNCPPLPDHPKAFYLGHQAINVDSVLSQFHTIHY